MIIENVILSDGRSPEPKNPSPPCHSEPVGASIAPRPVKSVPFSQFSIDKYVYSYYNMVITQQKY